MKKVVYEDDGRDKAIVGEILKETSLFYYILDKYNKKFQIAKKRIISISDLVRK